MVWLLSHNQIYTQHFWRPASLALGCTLYYIVDAVWVFLFSSLSYIVHIQCWDTFTWAHNWPVFERETHSRGHALLFEQIFGCYVAVSLTGRSSEWWMILYIYTLIIALFDFLNSRIEAQCLLMFCILLIFFHFCFVLIYSILEEGFPRQIVREWSIKLLKRSVVRFHCV